MRLLSVLVAITLSVWTSPTLAEPDEGLEAFSRPARLVALPDGRRVNLVCAGQGGPAVVIETGFRSWSIDTSATLRRLAVSRRVCAYDRAGLGFSDPTPSKRTPTAVAEDLRNALLVAGEVGPYVLVGHSKGANYIRAFKAAYPDQVVAMVFADPGGPERLRRMHEVDPKAAGADAWLLASLQSCVRAAGAELSGKAAPRFCRPEPEANWPAQLAAAYTAIVSSENFALANLREMEAPQDLPLLEVGAWGEMPVVVLTAGDGLDSSIPPNDRARLRGVQLEFARALSSQSRRGRQHVLPNASHDLLGTTPDAIATAVEEALVLAK